MAPMPLSFPAVYLLRLAKSIPKSIVFALTDHAPQLFIARNSGLLHIKTIGAFQTPVFPPCSKHPIRVFNRGVSSRVETRVFCDISRKAF